MTGIETIRYFSALITIHSKALPVSPVQIIYQLCKQWIYKCENMLAQPCRFAKLFTQNNV